MDTQDLQDQIQKLTARVELLETWQQAKTKQQLTYPIDDKTLTILNTNFASVGDFFKSSTGSAAGKISDSFLLKQAGKSYLIDIALDLFSFTANASTDFITFGPDVSTGLVPVITTGERVLLFSQTGLPGGLDDVTVYWTVSSSNNNTKLSLTSGGTAINITTNGSQGMYASIVG